MSAVGHEADVTRARSYVRFQEDSGHNANQLSLPSLTQSRLHASNWQCHFTARSRRHLMRAQS